MALKRRLYIRKRRNQEVLEKCLKFNFCSSLVQIVIKWNLSDGAVYNSVAINTKVQLTFRAGSQIFGIEQELKTGNEWGRMSFGGSLCPHSHLFGNNRVKWIH